MSACEVVFLSLDDREVNDQTPFGPKPNGTRDEVCKSALLDILTHTCVLAYEETVHIT